MSDELKWRTNYRPAGYVIYDHPADRPDAFVVVEWFALPSGELVRGTRIMLAATIEDARDFIPAHCINFGRTLHDDPTIVEAWI